MVKLRLVEQMLSKVVDVNDMAGCGHDGKHHAINR